MTFDQLVKVVSRRRSTPISQNRAFVRDLLAAVKCAVHREGRFVIPDFAVFTVKPLKERKIHNPMTGEPMVLPRSKTVRARASSTWRKVK